MLKRESENCEFKKSSGEAIDSMKSVCAMLNKYGEGVIYYGVKNDGTLVKNEICDSSLRDISRAIYECIEPKITPCINTLTIDGVEIIKLSFHGINQPYSSKGVYYIRSADENRPMSQKELLNLFQNKHYEDEWEKQITKYTIDDIDVSTLKNFYNAAKNVNRLEMDDYDIESLLSILGLIENGKLNNAGYYLFGKNPKLEIKMAVYRTKEKINFIDLKSARGNIYNLVNQGIGYIHEHINWKVDIGSRKRKEIPEIPEKAIREIVVNSFAHAKYGSSFLNEINIYPDSIEIINSGTFPENLTPDDFINKRISSMKRNPIILDALFRSKDVEKSGTGFSRMDKLCKKYNVKWKYEKNEFGFNFIFIRNRGVNNGVDFGVDSFDSNYDKIYGLLKERNSATIEQISAYIGTSTRTAQRVLKELKDEGKITRVGTKNGYWKINIQ